MKLLAMVVSAVRGRGLRVFTIWLVGVVGMAFLFRAVGDGALEEPAMLGMAMALAIVVLLGDVLVTAVRARFKQGPPPPPAPPSNPPQPPSGGPANAP